MSTSSTCTPVLQFGTSRFLQAHVDLFLSEALAGGDHAVGPVTVVQSSGDASRAGRLQALAAPDGFPVRIQGLIDGRPTTTERRVTSVKRALSTATDWDEITRIARDEAEIILSNTSDAGWVAQAADARPQFDQAMSYPAKLTHLLRARWEGGGRPLQIMPTELVARNGTRLRDRVLTLAADLHPGLADWVSRDVRFVNSLVDRIVSASIEPAGAVAEPYALWAIEACAGLVLPCAHPSVRVVADLARIERLKLHILNLGHTWMVADWIQRDRPEEYVREIMATPELRARLEDLYRTEVLPGFAARGISEAPDYARITLDRFANPFLDHRLSDIAQNHAEKVRRRIGDFLDWAGTDAPVLRRLTQLVDP